MHILLPFCFFAASRELFETTRLVFKRVVMLTQNLR